MIIGSSEAFEGVVANGGVEATEFGEYGIDIDDAAGVRLITHLNGARNDELSIDMPLEADFSIRFFSKKSSPFCLFRR